MEREREVFMTEKEEMEQKYAEADQAMKEVRKILTMGKHKRRNSRQYWATCDYLALGYPSQA